MILTPSDPASLEITFSSSSVEGTKARVVKPLECPQKLAPVHPVSKKSGVPFSVDTLTASSEASTVGIWRSFTPFKTKDDISSVTKDAKKTRSMSNRTILKLMFFSSCLCYPKKNGGTYYLKF